MTAGPRPHVLVVEDERVVARWTATVLERAGYATSLVTDAVVLPQTIATLRPDLVLLDVDLAGRDGIAVVAALPPPGVPVVLVTGSYGPEMITRAQTIHLVGYVVKPYSAAQLTTSVELALTALRTGVRPLELLRTTRAPSTAPVPGLETLTPRERDVLDALLRHQRIARVSRVMDLSPHTVKNHLKKVYAKLGVHSQVALLELFAPTRRAS